MKLKIDSEWCLRICTQQKHNNGGLQLLVWQIDRICISNYHCNIELYYRKTSQSMMQMHKTHLHYIHNFTQHAAIWHIAGCYYHNNKIKQNMRPFYVQCKQQRGHTTAV
jgi:hypothetical protein